MFVLVAVIGGHGGDLQKFTYAPLTPRLRQKSAFLGLASGASRGVLHCAVLRVLCCGGCGLLLC